MSDQYGEWKCEACDVRKYSPKSWQEHVDEEHDGLDPRAPAYPCVNPRCRREFATREEMEHHLEAHFDNVFVSPLEVAELEYTVHRIVEYAEYCRERGIEP